VNFNKHKVTVLNKEIEDLKEKKYQLTIQNKLKNVDRLHLIKALINACDQISSEWGGTTTECLEDYLDGGEYIDVNREYLQYLGLEE